MFSNLIEKVDAAWDWLIGVRICTDDLGIVFNSQVMEISLGVDEADRNCLGLSGYYRCMFFCEK